MFHFANVEFTIAGSLVTCWYANNINNTESCDYEKYEDWCDAYGEEDLAVEDSGC